MGAVRTTFSLGVAYLLLESTTDYWRPESFAEELWRVLAFLLAVCLLPMLRWAEWYAVVRLTKGDMSLEDARRAAGRLTAWSFVVNVLLVLIVIMLKVFLVPETLKFS